MSVYVCVCVCLFVCDPFEMCDNYPLLPCSAILNTRLSPAISPHVPHLSSQISKEMLQFKNKVTPYETRKLFGRTEKTIVRGRVVFDGQKLVGKPNVAGMFALGPCKRH